MTAACPCCHKQLVVRLDGTFPAHRQYGGGNGHNGRNCPASFWLVEDEEAIPC